VRRYDKLSTPFVLYACARASVCERVCCNDETEQIRYSHDSCETANADDKVQLLMCVGELVRSADSLAVANS
jgi:hypothetical protein